MIAESLTAHLRERPDELRLVIYHACQGEDRPVVARRFAMAWRRIEFKAPDQHRDRAHATAALCCAVWGLR